MNIGIVFDIGEVAGIPVHVLSTVLFCAVGILLFNKTPFGRHVLATGGSVACFDFMDWVSLYTLALTTVEQEAGDYASLAVDTLLYRIGRKEYADMAAYKDLYKKTIMPMKLIIRHSTRDSGRETFGEKAPRLMNWR